MQIRSTNSSGNRLTSVTDLMPGFSLSPQADGDRNGVMAPAGTSYGSSPKDSNVSPISQSLSGRKDKKRDLSILIPEGQALKGDVLRVANRSASGDDAQNHGARPTPLLPPIIPDRTILKQQATPLPARCLPQHSDDTRFAWPSRIWSFLLLLLLLLSRPVSMRTAAPSRQTIRDCDLVVHHTPPRGRVDSPLRRVDH